MGSYLRYRCPRCRFDIAIGGPDEFYLGADGERRPYGHPEPASEEAARRGVDGFWMTLWCDGCRAARRVVTVEFEQPCAPLDAWSGRGVACPGYLVDEESCPDCASVLLDEIPGATPLCPSCRAGPLVSDKFAD